MILYLFFIKEKYHDSRKEKYFRPYLENNMGRVSVNLVQLIGTLHNVHKYQGFQSQTLNYSTFNMYEF